MSLTSRELKRCIGRNRGWTALAAWIVLAALLLLPATGGHPRTASAAGIQITTQTAANQFPNGVKFSLFATSDANINEVRLRYRILPDGANVMGRPTCTTGSAVSCNLTVGATREQFLVPGVVINYSWEVDDANGQKLQSDQLSHTYVDNRFQWDSFTEGLVTINFYSGNDSTIRSIMQATQETLDRSGRISGGKVDFPIKVWVYQNSNDMRAAILSQRGIQPNQSNPTTLGEVVFSDTALVSRDTQPLDIVRHEVSHIVMRAATKGLLGDPPAWVDEGFAVYSQNRLLQDEITALDIAIRRNRPLSIFSLSSNSLTQTDTSLFYAQSWSTVKYLIDTFGEAKFAEFVAAFKDNTTSGALQTAYGFNAEGLEDRWRASVGLPALAPAAAGSSSTQSSSASIPTLVPFGSSSQGASATAVPSEPQPSSAAAGADDEGGNSLVPIIGGLTALVAVTVLGAGFVVARRTREG